MITLNQNIEIEQNYVIQILIVLLFIFLAKLLLMVMLKDIAGDVERCFDTSNHDENDKRPLPIGENKTAPGFFKDELGGKRWQ